MDVLGHTDCDGANDYNYDLSGNRAASVAHYLASQQLDPALLGGRPGENEPVASNATPRQGAEPPRGNPDRSPHLILDKGQLKPPHDHGA